MINIVPFSSSGHTITKKIVWMCDLHLDAAEQHVVQQLLYDLSALKPDLILIGGDTSNGYTALRNLLSISQAIDKDLYFVLGNHEFYHGSISNTRELAQKLTHSYKQIHYLTKEHIVELTPNIALVGHDGWSDARAGNFMNSIIALHDYTLIDDLKNLTKDKLRLKLHQLGNQAARDIEKKLTEALKKYSHVIILTHTPPFQDACLYDKEISDDNWAPHFVCKAMGDILLKIMKAHPSKQAIVFCGHSHQLADISILPNLRVMVAESTLGAPQIQGLINV